MDEQTGRQSIGDPIAIVTQEALERGLLALDASTTTHVSIYMHASELYDVPTDRPEDARFDLSTLARFANLRQLFLAVDEDFLPEHSQENPVSVSIPREVSRRLADGIETMDWVRVYQVDGEPPKVGTEEAPDLATGLVLRGFRQSGAKEPPMDTPLPVDMDSSAVVSLDSSNFCKNVGDGRRWLVLFTMPGCKFSLDIMPT